jgi:hypothetical protein
MTFHVDSPRIHEAELGFVAPTRLLNTLAFEEDSMPAGKLSAPTRSVKDITVHGDVAVVPLTRGQFCIIDADDIPMVSGIVWQALQVLDDPGQYYARSSDGLLLHVMLMRPSEGEDVDHRNRCKLDNRRANLRLASRTLNAVNWIRENKAGYRGLSQMKNGTFGVSVTDGGRRVQLGTYESAEYAARIYDAAAAAIHGEFAVLNFPDAPPDPNIEFRFRCTTCRMRLSAKGWAEFSAVTSRHKCKAFA